LNIAVVLRKVSVAIHRQIHQPPKNVDISGAFVSMKVAMNILSSKDSREYTHHLRLSPVIAAVVTSLDVLKIGMTEQLGAIFTKGLEKVTVECL
jgi:hypothetical protein